MLPSGAGIFPCCPAVAALASSDGDASYGASYSREHPLPGVSRGTGTVGGRPGLSQTPLPITLFGFARVWSYLI